MFVICNHRDKCGRTSKEECEHCVPHTEKPYCRQIFDSCLGWKDVICVAVYQEPDWEV